MCSSTTTYPNVIFCFQVLSSGVFELKLTSFENDDGLNASGSCCNGFRTSGLCTSPCRTFFRICLKHYQADSTPDPPCTFGEFNTPVLGGNTFDFPAEQGAFTNPIKLPFDFIWPVS